MKKNILKVCMESGQIKPRMIESWCQSMERFRKLNVDRAVRGTLRVERTGGVLQNHKREVLTSVSKPIGVKISNKAEMAAFLKALRIYSGFSYESCIVESDLSMLLLQYEFQCFLYEILPIFIDSGGPQAYYLISK